jgi:hypothetical protein
MIQRSQPLPVIRFWGWCSHCRQRTESLRSGEVACKWGLCNGTVLAVYAITGSAEPKV